ncbi:glycerol-3-phosphate cytidylyltransferase [Lysinibacillus sphaericus]|uniref:glycerol-3-phosphate cytidylyltransferase n=1 Tax=Lysinibacillus sphaericus TaxID=1421 RepID=UPI0018CE56D5|nr:glycerol-3-phosphate cytidylyltransferase [Lysinibacillus sphaericus]MBG9478252.1 glycerol-3-phosphate cytidylyltransferase [Lysinibacillus sphaericus]MBG9590965.1 glycerol-3-phosphate cytidylyltransferase [Lysinibacillus sphaericus]
MKVVLTYGTFDLLHWGHIKLLKRAKELGNHLIVALSTDEFNALKGKCSFYNYEERKFMLQAVKYVDEIIPEESWEQKEKDIFNKNVDIFVMGDDWKGKFDHLNKVCKVIYLSRTEGISTTQIKRNLLLERNQRKFEND